MEIIPVINKIDLPDANPAKVKEQLHSMFDIDPKDCIEVEFHYF
jgi:translation elongation factor EF-4